MSTDTARTASQGPFYVSGPLDPEALADTLRAVHGVLCSKLGHDVYTALYDANKAAGSGFQMPEFEQITRAVLHALFGIGALEVRDPLRALQLWQARNSGVTLVWAFGEAVSLISAEDRARIDRARAEQRSASVETDA
jgi:hypothetical protein